MVLAFGRFCDDSSNGINTFGLWMMNSGEVLQVGMWLAGTETADEINHYVDEIAREALRASAAENGMDIEPELNVEFMDPNEDRVPEVPDGVQGPKVTFLVVEALVIDSVLSASPESLFAADLEPDDLRRLREITRRAYKEAMPHAPRLSDGQCSTIINDLGPEAAELALKCGEANLSGVLH